MASALIGRRAELAWLRARVDLALGGFAHLVIVEGESGIGKTRLAQEAPGHARHRRAAVLRGRCYDHLDWADSATGDLLRHLLFRLDDEQVPLLVLTTSRADPAGRAAEAVARLRSEPRTAVVHLNPLSALEATELLREREPGAPIDR